jgi:poly(3-hydroxybutyrate) depolymerase
MKRLLVALFLAASAANAADEPKHDEAWPPKMAKDSTFVGRKLDAYKHGILKEWGYAKPQQDTFLVLHPKDEKSETKTKTPLYVVLHSAGHDVHTCLACTTKVGNHDIYHTPDGFFGLYLDCRANMGDWWWGINTYPGPTVGPTEKRVVDTVKWVVQHYGLDENRVYLCGNSMGGSGTLGIGMRHGDLFAAIKANVPAGVKHVGSRMHFTPGEGMAETKFADPPIAIDYSAPNDGWAKGHEGFAKAMNDRKYALIMYWGPFGHANDHRAILKVNDLIDSFDWLQVKKNELYPVFTNASTNDALPWPDKLDDKKPGQVNAFFRWKQVSDTQEKAEVSLRLLGESEVKTKFKLPTESTADVTLRRLQRFHVKPGESVRWSFGEAGGEANADPQGLFTIPQLKVKSEPAVLRLVRKR